MVPNYRLHDHTGDDLGLLEHPAPNVEPGDILVLTDGREALVTLLRRRLPSVMAQAEFDAGAPTRPRSRAAPRAAPARPPREPAEVERRVVVGELVPHLCCRLISRTLVGESRP